jgi:hypothetical protein
VRKEIFDCERKYQSHLLGTPRHRCLRLRHRRRVAHHASRSVLCVSNAELSQHCSDRTLVVAAAIFLSQTAFGDSLTVVPRFPTSASPTILEIDGRSNVFPLGAFLKGFAIQGNTITVQGCYPFPAFSGLSTYQLTVNLGLRPPGTFSVQYLTSRCDSSTGNPLDPFALQASATFNVLLAANGATAIPVLGLEELIVFALLLAAVGFLQLHR